MISSTNLQILINKLKEQGALTKRRANVARWLAKKLDSPVGKLIKGLLVKLIVDIILDALDGR